MARLAKLMLLATVVLGAVFFYYVRNVTAVPLTAADLDRGGRYTTEERATLKSACVAQTQKDAEQVCGCVVDKAATDVSRFDRLVLTATYRQKLADVVALSKGLAESGIARAKVKAAEDESRARVRDMLKACNATAG